MRKTCWTSTQIFFWIWSYEQGHGKPRWKTSMISNDAIHVQAKKWGKDNNVEGIITPKVDDYLCVMHDVCRCAKPAVAMYKRPQLGQGTRRCCLWDGWALGASTNDSRIIHGWWDKQGVKCEDKLNVIEETGWNKIDPVGIIWWGGGDVSW
jgi:hypothetical protein